MAEVTVDVSGEEGDPISIEDKFSPGPDAYEIRFPSLTVTIGDGQFEELKAALAPWIWDWVPSRESAPAPQGWYMVKTLDRSTGESGRTITYFDPVNGWSWPSGGSGEITHWITLPPIPEDDDA